MHTVKVLALHHVGPDLYAVLDLLKCFPCLQSLYIVVSASPDCFKCQNIMIFP